MKIILTRSNKTQSRPVEENLGKNEFIDINFKEKSKQVHNDMKLKILRMYYQEGRSRSEISQTLLLSYSTTCRIIRDYELHPMPLSTLFRRHEVRIQD